MSIGMLVLGVLLRGWGTGRLGVGEWRYRVLNGESSSVKLRQEKCAELLWLIFPDGRKSYADACELAIRAGSDEIA